MAKRPILLTASNLAHINVREWGMPSLFVGKVWRSERHRTVTCLLPKGPTNLLIQTRPVFIVDRVVDQWIPATWARAMAAYRTQWPNSAPRILGVRRG